MKSVRRERPLADAALSEGRRGCSAPAVREPGAADPLHRARALTSAEPPGPRMWFHLKPGQKGTKQLLAQYGDRFLCVRYRYDAQRKKRLKTVELLVTERDWEPVGARPPSDHIVGLRVAYADRAVRDRVKEAGGRWNPERRVWQLRYDRVVALGLTSRIVDDEASNTGCPEPSSGHLHIDARAASR